MESDRTGAETTDPGAKSVHRRPLSRPEGPERWDRAAPCDRIVQRISDPVQRFQPTERNLVPYHRHRFGAPSRWADLRSGGQFALPLRRFLCSAKPPVDEKLVSGGFRVRAHSSGFELSAPIAGHAGVPRPGWRATAYGPADAGYL